MRWVFMFLVVLNIFYCIWHQQQAPLRPVLVAPLELYQGADRNIRLLSEAASTPRDQQDCLLLGGFAAPAEARALELRMVKLAISTKWQPVKSAGTLDYWLLVSAKHRAQVDAPMLKRLSLEFKGLRHQQMSCEVLARLAENA